MCVDLDVDFGGVQTPLHCAIEYDCEEGAELLIEAGANLDQQDNEGRVTLSHHLLLSLPVFHHILLSRRN